MAQSQFKLRAVRSRDDYQSFQVILPKYNPERVKDIFLHIHPSQIITSDHPFATLHIDPVSNTPNSSQTSHTQPLSIVLSGIVVAVGDHFEEITWQDKKSWHLKDKANKGNLQILRIRECDHQPNDEKMLGGDFLTQSTPPSHHLFSSSVSICKTCKLPLWKYYEQKQVEITLGQLCSMNRLSTEDLEKDFSWSIIKNQQFTSTTEVGRSEDVEVRVPHLAKATFLIEWEEHKRKANDSTVMMRLRRVICGHEKVVEGRCQFCMEQVALEHISKMGSYLFHQQASKNVLISGKLLRQQQQQYIQQLLHQQKAMIILDLDNTILHSHQISDMAESTVQQLSQYYIIPKIDGPFETLPNRKDLIVVKMRPYFKHFLYIITKYYEVYVYTKGTRIYAEEICKYIRSQYAGQEIAHPFRTWESQPLLFLKDKKSFLTNIISRDQDGNLESKSFEKILPSKKEYHLILDDRRDVWKNSPSWFFTREYYYFQKKIIEKAQKSNEQAKPELIKLEVINEVEEECANEAPKEQEVKMIEQNEPVETIKEQKKQSSVKDLIMSQYNEIVSHYPEKARIIEGIDKKDCFLLFAAHSLKKVHRRFFEALKAEQERPTQTGKQSKANLAYQYAKLKHQFFRNSKFNFFMEKGQDQTNNSTISRAKKMGAIISQDDSPRLAVRSRNLVKSIKKQGCLQHKLPTCDSCVFYFEQNKKLNQLFNSRIPVVSESWIHYCYEFNFPFSWEPFRLYDPFQQQIEHQHYYHVIQEQASAILRKIERQMAQDLSP